MCFLWRRNALSALSSDKQHSGGQFCSSALFVISLSELHYFKTDNCSNLVDALKTKFKAYYQAECNILCLHVDLETSETKLRF